MFQATPFANLFRCAGFLLLCGALAFAPATPPQAPQLLGAPVPDVTVHDVAAKPVKLSQFKGKATVISFWATWCGPCIKEMPAFSQLVETYQGKLQVLAIATGDTRADVVQFIQKNPTHKFTWLLDPEEESENSALAKAFGLTGLPTNVFIDADGKVIDHWRGLENTEALVKKIQGLMAK